MRNEIHLYEKNGLKIYGTEPRSLKINGAFHEAVKTYEAVKNTYACHDYQLIEVPKISVENRVQFILTIVKSID